MTIISDLSPATVNQYHDYLISLSSQVQLAISQFDDIVIGNRLVEMGLDDTYARLFVSNIKKHAPTEEYKLRQISKISDDVFLRSIPEIIKSTWDYTTNEDELAEKFNISKEQVRCVMEISRPILNFLARGEMTKETLQKKYADKLSPIKYESFSNSLLINQKHWYDSMLFSNVQDTRFAVDHIIKQNDVIINLLNRVFQSET